MNDPTYGWLSLLPPVAAIALAVATRRVYLSLLAGVAVGAAILQRGRPVDTLVAICEQHLWPALVDPEHLRVFAFTALMGAMVGVLRKAGGFEAIVEGLRPLARSRRSAQLTVWLLGLVVFFDDYANSLLLGNTMRPLADHHRISREKLAYLVDSTAAPVSGLALISTWVASEIGYIRDGFDKVAFLADADGLAMFIATIPYRFYVLGALALVPMIALTGRDFGPMLLAEREASQRKPSLQPSARLDQPTSARWFDALLPVAVVVVVTLVLILATGYQRAIAEGPANAGWLSVFGGGNSYLALVYGALAGLGTAMLLASRLPHLDVKGINEAAIDGARHVLPALAILWLAWALSSQTDKDLLGTGNYLAEIVNQAIDVRLLPTAVFVLAAAVAFSTGTSWGAMAILMPLVIPVAAGMLAAENSAVTAQHPLLIAAVGSVLAGAIFGDHCSPISDTTVLSSQASGCEHIAHVRTQLPYALVVALVSILLGTLPVGFGVSVWWLLPGGLAALVVIVRIFGRRL